jgi:hypothetical protein
MYIQRMKDSSQIELNYFAHMRRNRRYSGRVPLYLTRSDQPIAGIEVK